MTRDKGGLSLLFRANRHLCALPLAQVAETMRHLPVSPIAGAPDFVLGVAIIRGTPVPVIDAARLLGAGESRPTRLIALRIDGRQVALAVDEVLGIRAMTRQSLRDLPPLLRAADGQAVSAIGALDAELLLFLETARMVPDATWAALEAGAQAP